MSQEPLTVSILETVGGSFILINREEQKNESRIFAELQGGGRAFKGVDVKDLQGQVAKLTKDLSDQAEAHKKQLADLAFDGVLKEAITAARGRNTKAIAALLDVDALKASKDQTADIKSALEALKKDSGYLFDSEETPPPYSPLAGTQHPPAGKEFNFGFTGVRAPEAKH